MTSTLQSVNDTYIRERITELRIQKAVPEQAVFFVGQANGKWAIAYAIYHNRTLLHAIICGETATFPPQGKSGGLGGGST